MEARPAVVDEAPVLLPTIVIDVPALPAGVATAPAAPPKVGVTWELVPPGRPASVVLPQAVSVMTTTTATLLCIAPLIVERCVHVARPLALFSRQL